MTADAYSCTVYGGGGNEPWNELRLAWRLDTSVTIRHESAGCLACAAYIQLHTHSVSYHTQSSGSHVRRAHNSRTLLARNRTSFTDCTCLHLPWPVKPPAAAHSARCTPSLSCAPYSFADRHHPPASQLYTYSRLLFIGYRPEGELEEHTPPPVSRLAERRTVAMRL